LGYNEFIHSLKDLYSTSSGKLLRGAIYAISSTVEKNSFQLIIECVRKYPRREAQCKREAIPYRRDHHRTSAALQHRLHDSGIVVR